jgi:hypothetical protein
MTSQELTAIVNYIVDEGDKINKKYLDEVVGPVDYVAIFCKDENEKNELTNLITNLGEAVDETPTGINYKLNSPIETNQGPVILIKIRNTDPQKPHRGALDFRVKDYASFKNKYLGREHFNLIERPDFEMIEIWDPEADVLVYYPNIPLTQQLKI